MTETRIDLVARSIANRLSRRRLLGGLGGGTVAAAGLAATTRPALVCQRVGTTCDETHACCAGASCRGGRCVCRDGWEACDGRGRCVDTAADADHCGRCGHACATGETCCGGRCVATKRDRDNCGACGTVCDGDALCVLGSCYVCPLGTSPCRNACRAAKRCHEG